MTAGVIVQPLVPEPDDVIWRLFAVLAAMVWVAALILILNAEIVPALLCTAIGALFLYQAGRMQP